MILSSVQWLFFIFTNTVVVPISIAAVFELPQELLEMMLKSSLIFTGLACVFQGWVGHRFPIMEGHSGLLWGVILNLGLSASSLGLSLSKIGGGIATGIFLACLVTILIVVFNGIPFLKSVFSPMVMTVYLFLLTFQLIFIFFNGMFPLAEDGTILVPEGLFSLVIVVLVSVLKIKGTKILSNFSILIGIIVGWLFYEILFLGDVGQAVQTTEVAFNWFPLGKPNLEIGIVAVSFFAVILNLSNAVTSISTVGDFYKNVTISNKQYSSSIVVTSFFTGIGTCFGLVPFTPFTSSIGFLQSTQIFRREPFFIGGGLITLIGLVPVFTSFLATMPISVGNAVLFVAYLQLFGTAYNSLEGKLFNSNTVFRLAAPVLIGLSLMNIPTSVFSSLPLFVQPFISNGLIVGVLLSIVLERIVNWSMLDPVQKNTFSSED